MGDNLEIFLPGFSPLSMCCTWYNTLVLTVIGDEVSVNVLTSESDSTQALQSLSAPTAS